MGVKTEITIVDSRAIKILQGGAILRGFGNELHLHCQNEDKSRVLSQKLLAKVHGISTVITNTECGRLIVHGEKECMMLEYSSESLKYSFRELCHFKITDWISSATFLKDPNDFILVTYHSVVLRILYDKEAPNNNFCRITKKSSSNDKSTLLCSHIYGNKFEELMIFGGNALGELLIWKPSKQGETFRHINVDLVRRTSAHNGVVFSIDFNAEFNLLITTSDDRSIRFWKIDAADFNLVLLASGYGHISRIFKGKIILSDGRPFAITVGEDSFVCVWKTNAELAFKKRLHFGAVIWNLEYDSKTYTLYTVDSIGNLLAYNLEDALKNSAETSYTKTFIEFDIKEYVAKAKFFETNMIVGITNKYRLIYTRALNPCCTEYGSWNILDMQKVFKCTVLEVRDNHIAVCGFRRLVLFKCSEERVFKKVFDGDILDGVIRAFHFLSNSIFLISDHSGNCLILRGDGLQHRTIVPLPHCKEPWTTSALYIQSQTTKNYLVISNRMGNMILFHLDIGSAECSHLATLRQPHGPLGATILRVQEISDEYIYIQSAGHDGSMHSFVIKENNIYPQLKRPLPVAWVEDLVILENIEYYLGFNDNHFVVWSKQHDFSVQVPCGGGHRSWHYNLITDDRKKLFIQLLFIKRKEMRFHKTKLFNAPVNGIKLVSNDWHTRPCNILTTIEQFNGKIPLTITISAGDDNMIKISKLVPSGQLINCAELHSHISNVKTLKVLPINKDEVLIFSGGGRAQLCIAHLNLNRFRLQELLNYTLNKTKEHKNARINKYHPDPETRIMACDVVKVNNNSSDLHKDYFIYLSCSDGYLRKIHINQYINVVSEETKYYGCCLLQIKIFADRYVLTAGTDGKIRFFDLNLVELSFQLSHHASGVNAMDILFNMETCILHILSGGDDQTISYTSLHLQKDESFEIHKQFHLTNAHSAQVTAVQLHHDSNTFCGYTSGLDQILNMVDINNQHISFICRTCVADTKGLIVDQFNRCFIYGCGIQILKLIKP